MRSSSALIFKWNFLSPQSTTAFYLCPIEVRRPSVRPYTSPPLQNTLAALQKKNDCLNSSSKTSPVESPRDDVETENLKQEREMSSAKPITKKGLEWLPVFFFLSKEQKRWGWYYGAAHVNPAPSPYSFLRTKKNLLKTHTTLHR